MSHPESSRLSSTASSSTRGLTARSLRNLGYRDGRAGKLIAERYAADPCYLASHRRGVEAREEARG